MSLSHRSACARNSNDMCKNADLKRHALQITVHRWSSACQSSANIPVIKHGWRISNIYTADDFTTFFHWDLHWKFPLPYFHCGAKFNERRRSSKARVGCTRPSRMVIYSLVAWRLMPCPTSRIWNVKMHRKWDLPELMQKFTYIRVYKHIYIYLHTHTIYCI